MKLNRLYPPFVIYVHTDPFLTSQFLRQQFVDEELKWKRAKNAEEDNLHQSCHSLVFLFIAHETRLPVFKFQLL